MLEEHIVKMHNVYADQFIKLCPEKLGRALSCEEIEMIKNCVLCNSFTMLESCESTFLYSDSKERIEDTLLYLKGTVDEHGEVIKKAMLEYAISKEIAIDEVAESTMLDIENHIFKAIKP